MKMHISQTLGIIEKLLIPTIFVCQNKNLKLQCHIEA